MIAVLIVGIGVTVGLLIFALTVLAAVGVTVSNLGAFALGAARGMVGAIAATVIVERTR